MYLLWKRWSRVGSLWDGSPGRKVIVRRVHDQLSQLQHQDFQHRCAIFLKKILVRIVSLGVIFLIIDILFVNILTKSQQLQHQDFQHRCAIFLKMLWVWGLFHQRHFDKGPKSSAMYYTRVKFYFSALLVAWKSCRAVGFLSNIQKCNLSSMRTSPGWQNLAAFRRGQKKAMKIFVKPVFTIFATNASFLRVIANLQL